MHTTSSTGFDDRVRAVMACMDTTGLIDRFAANDVLLDLLDAAGTGEESARVLGALAALPKSELVDRSMLAGLLANLGDHIDTTS
jgi:hypothetical protein